MKAGVDVVLTFIKAYIGYRLLNKFDGKYLSLSYLKDKAMSYFKSSKVLSSTLDQALDNKNQNKNQNLNENQI